MRRLTPHFDAVRSRMALGLLGFLCLASTEVSALFVREHAILRAGACGAQSPHCAWCYSAAGFALAGLAALAAALSPKRATAGIRAR